MTYRIEISSNSRAGCQDASCKKESKKIQKGTIRFGTYITIRGTDHGSWKWKHWGCVSGFTIANLQRFIVKDDNYEWDMIDGYNDLIVHPDIQEKIRRVIIQGHIDPWEFNGDPDFNHPGKKAIRSRSKKPKVKNDEDEAENKDNKTRKKSKKRSRDTSKEDTEKTEARPAKKKSLSGVA